MFTSCRGQLPSGSQDLQLLPDEGCFSLKSCLWDGAVEVSMGGGVSWLSLFILICSLILRDVASCFMFNMLVL